VCSGRRDLGQVQAEAMYVGVRRQMATAMRVFARLFVWEAVAVRRDERLLARVIGMARPAARPGQAILRWLQVVCSHHAQGMNADAPGWWWTAHRQVAGCARRS